MPTMQERLLSKMLNAQAQAFTIKIMKLAASEQTDPAIVALAVADVLGMTAAKLDQTGDQYTLQDRLHEVCRRVEETYERYRHQTE